MSTPESIRYARVAGLLTAVEAGALVVYCIALGIAALNSSGASEGAPAIEILIFLVFAVGIGFVAKGMFAASHTARPPFFLTQIFVLIVAYTLIAGDGAPVKIIGALVALLGVAAFVVGAVSIAKDDTPAR